MRFLARLVLWPLWLNVCCGPVFAQEREFDGLFRQALEQLAVKCDELELPQQASTTRSWWIDRDPQRHYLFVPPKAKQDLANDAPRLEQLWHKHFLDIRRQQAERLFALAKETVEVRPDLSYQWLFEVLREDANHAEARRILGYRLSGDRWIRRERPVRPKVGTIRHPRYDWNRGKYWVVESEHFRITTNHSVAQGQRAAEKLEAVFSAWRQLFYSYWALPNRLVQRFAGQDLTLSARVKFEVVLFRDRQEYVDQLSSEPLIAKTVGYYSQQEQTSFFFVSDDDSVTTWYHEATHQFFQESANAVDHVGRSTHFWLVEGLALYMESLRQLPGYFTLGGFDADRLQFARYRALNQKFYLPLAEFTAMGREDLQQHEDIRRLYSQAAGLIHSLLDDSQRRYTEAVVGYAQRVYGGRESLPILAELANQALAELDQNYRSFLVVDDAQTAFVGPSAAVRNLSLGRTAVTAQGLNQLRSLNRLVWLDLTGIPANDQDLQWVTQNVSLSQLTLEGTQITDAWLVRVGRLRNLEELDLTATAVTDQGLKHVAGLKNLKVIYLTHTQVTDNGLRSLAGLKQLQLVELTGTQTTKTGQDWLKAQLPNWR